MAEIRNRITLDGANDVKAALASIQQAAQTLVDRLNALSSSSGLDRARQQSETLRNSIASTAQQADNAGSRIVNAFSTAAGSITRLVTGVVEVGAKTTLVVGGLAAAAAAATSALATSAAQSVTAISDSAEALGLTVQQFQRIQNAALSAGTSQEKFASGVGALRKAYDQAVSAAREFQNTTVVTESTYDQLGVTVRSFGDAQQKAQGPNAAAVELFRRLGVSLVDAQGQAKDFGLVLTQVRDAFSRLSPSQQIALQGSARFGETVRQLGPFLKAGRQDINDYNEAWDKSSRGITQAEQDVAIALTAAQADLSDALSATANKVGLLFAPGKTRTAEFFTEILDGTRAATVEFARMAQASAKAFVIDNAQGFLTFFQRVGETIRNLAEQAAPALTSLLDTTKRLANEGFQALASQLTKLTGVGFTAEFLKAATAVAALTGSFSSLSLISTPVVAVLTTVAGLIVGLGPISVVAGLAVVAFWDDFRRAAVAAYDAVANQSDVFRKAFEALKFGDFQGAFDLLKRAGVDAFNALLAQAPGLRRQFTNLQNAVLGVGANIRGVFQTIRGLLTGVAIALNQVFGTNLTASSIAFYVALAQIAGVLNPVSNGLLALTNVMRVLGLQGSLVAVAILAVVRALPALDQFASRIRQALADIFSGDVRKGISELGEAFSKLFGDLTDQTALTLVVLTVAFGATFKAILDLLAGFGSLFVPRMAAAVGGAEVATAVTGAGTALGAGFQVAFLAAATVGLSAALAKFLKDVVKPIEDDARKALENTQQDQAVADEARRARNAADAESGNPALFGPRQNDEVTSSLTDLSDRAGKAFNDLTSRSLSTAAAGQKAADAIKAVGQAAREAASVAGAAVGKPIEDGLSRTQALGERAAEAIKRVGDAGTSVAASLGVAGKAAKDVADDEEDAADSADDAAEATDKWAVTVRSFGANGSKSVQAFGDDVRDAAKAVEDAAKPRVFNASDPAQLREFGRGLDDAKTKTDETAESTKSLVEVLQKALNAFVRTGDAADQAAKKASGGFKRITVPQSAGDGSSGFEGASGGGGGGESSALPGADQKAQGLAAAVDDLIGKVVGELTGAFASAAAPLTVALAQAGQAIDILIAKAGQLSDALRGALGSSQGSPGGGDSGTPGFASGGPVRGPGGPRSDSVLARLSAGEFVMRTAAVNHYGAPLMHLINSMRIGRDSLLRFAEGGLVPIGRSLAAALPALPAMVNHSFAQAVPLPAFADGGQVLAAPAASAGSQALHPVTINLPSGGSIKARMTPDEFDAALKASLVRRSMRGA